MNHDVSYTLFVPEQGDTPFPVLFQLHGLGDDHQSWLHKSKLSMNARDYPMAVMMPNTETGAYLNWRSGERLFRMGGYGAMRLGLKYPDRFASIWAHSSAFHIGDMVDASLLGEVGLDDANAYYHADRLKSSGSTPPVISFDCGVDDQLIEHNRDFHRHLESIGLEHHYAEHPGAHTWDYWDEHVKEALEQHARVFGIGRVERHFT